jgi:taurine dioxygenase
VNSPAQAAGSVLRGRVGRFEILPFDAALGAEIRGLDLRRLDDEGFRILKRAYLDHLVVLVRDQDLTDPQLVELAGRFGPLEMPPSARERSAHHHFDGPPEITVVSNVKVGGTPIGELGDGEVIWHSDYSFREVTAAMRLLYAIEVPPPGAGASTEFCNTYAAYDRLPADLKARVHGPTIKHDTAYDTNRNLRRGAQAVADVRLGRGPDHPIVYTHPETGCNALFLGRRLKHYVNGLELDESEAMLDTLWAHTVQPAHCVAHEWRAGDIVLWDNRCTLHRRGAFDSRSRRIMHAAQTRGQKPAEAPDARSRPPHPRADPHACEGNGAQ